MDGIEDLAERVADLEQKLRIEQALVAALHERIAAFEIAVDAAQKTAWSACRSWVESVLDGRVRAVPPADKLGARLFRLAELEVRATQSHPEQDALRAANQKGWDDAIRWVTAALDGSTRTDPSGTGLGPRLVRLSGLEERDDIAQQRALEDDDHPSVRSGR